MSEDNSYHVPVLLNETIESLNIKPDGIYVDCTFGGGGHAAAILNKLSSKGKLIAFDQDADVKNNELLKSENLIFIPENFRYLNKFLRLHNISQVDGIMADLGVSSHQFNKAERGFSTRFDAALDMRMDQRISITAEKVIATKTELELHKIFELYGEVTNSKTLAKTLVLARTQAPIKTIAQLKSIIHTIVKGNTAKYLAQVFQALRIVVNEEFETLKEMLMQTVNILKPEGRIAIISFHSLEDRIVKQFFKEGCFETKQADFFGNREKTPFELINKKPITASDLELKNNSRSRSAKLRAAKKI